MNKIKKSKSSKTSKQSNDSILFSLDGEIEDGKDGDDDGGDEEKKDLELLEKQLETVTKRLEKSFRAEFIDSLVYFIKVEHQQQQQLNNSAIDWNRLDYFVQQMKKICKNESHLKYLLEKLIVKKHHRQPSSDKSSEDDSDDTDDDEKTNFNKEHFILTKILVRLLLKLFRLDNAAIDTKIHDLKLLLLSCLADLCFYEELRVQIIHDNNLKDLFDKITTLSCSTKKMWSKLNRLAGNLCQEQKQLKLKDLFTSDYFSSLAKLLLVDDTDNDNNNLDFYHSVLRLIKYACELPDCKRLIIQHRLLVYLSRFIYKLNKNTKSTNETLSNEMLKQYLIIVDTWPQPLCCEFYNQMIEGNVIEYLLWLNEEEETITSKNELAFNVLFKFCRDYHACCSEFGRVGGIVKYINRVNAIDDNDDENKEFEKLLEMICLCCRESANRLRLREQNYLNYLIRLQQKLRKRAECEESSDLQLHNKLLVALCCFAHDQESMNILLANGLVDSLLAYVNDELKTDLHPSPQTTLPMTIDSIMDDKVRDEKKVNLAKLLLFNNSENNDISSTSIKPITTKKKKRKSAKIDESVASCLCKQMAKRSKFEESPPNFVEGSPTADSCCSLSPPSSSAQSPISFFSFASPLDGRRCNSACQMANHTPTSYSFSPQSSSSNGLPSPNFYWATTNNNTNNHEIQFSPSIKNETSDEEEEEDEDEDDEEHEEEIVDKRREIIMKPFLSPQSTTSSSSSSNIFNLTSLFVNKKEQFQTQQSIETINRTEACVFYILSQLSHGEKPSPFLLTNFDSIAMCLLSYLRNARVRNPRALRILNRLTRNQNCFYNFILAQFPYKLKTIFYGMKREPTSLENATTTATTNYPNLLLRSSRVDEKMIEKEMNLYLHSNKVFFDEHMFFPSFESIDFTLCNNLKSHCISSSDHGYFCLTSMMKQRPSERLACTLVAPFILRNPKALQNIMIQLNGLDLICDLITKDDNENDKVVLCVKRILAFVNYKRDLKQLNENFEAKKRKFHENNPHQNNIEDEEEEEVKFVFLDDANSTLMGPRQLLARKSDYFNALLNGRFMEGAVQEIELKQIDCQTLALILSLLKSPSQIIDDDLSFSQCVDIVWACDRFCLFDLKELFMAILMSHFISYSTWLSCFELAWQLNSSMLANALVDYLLSRFVDEEKKNKEGEDDENDQNNQLIKCSLFLNRIVKSLPQNSQQLEMFRKTFKFALSEIIKNNSWTF